jgi:hypothetical protein
MNEIQEAVLAGIKEKFSTEPHYTFVTDNNPIEVHVDGQFRGEIRVNTMDVTIEVWIPSNTGFSITHDGKQRPNCHPFKILPLESPTCFDELFRIIRALPDFLLIGEAHK